MKNECSITWIQALQVLMLGILVNAIGLIIYDALTYQILPWYDPKAECTGLLRSYVH